MTKKIVAGEDGIRLDLFLSREFSDYPRSSWMQVCRQGKVLVNGKCAKPGHSLRQGDGVELLQFPNQQEARRLITPTLPIVFSDEWLVVANKPRGMPSVTLSVESDPETVADNLATLFPECLTVSPDPREAGLVHRLDTGTSGLILAARSAAIWSELRKQLQEHEIEKEYLALVSGVVGEEITLSLFLSGVGKRVFVSELEKPGYSSITEKILPDRTLSEDSSIVKVIAPFAKRHQVRATLAHLGHPLVGDTLYGGVSSSDGFKLLASRLRFGHPVSKQQMDFELQWEELH